MSLAGKQKLRKVAKLTVNNVTRESITEVEIFINTAKAFVDTDEKRQLLDEAFAKLRNRMFDIGADEYKRLQRYLTGWEVEQMSADLDWVEYGPRLNNVSRVDKEGEE